MKILITGAKGMLAQAVQQKFAVDANGEPNELVLTDVAELDITNLEAVGAMVAKEKPNVVINCAAYTNVDGAEQAEELAEKVNALGPENLAKAAVENDVILVHISTDYVFGGQKPIQEIYSEDDEKNPQSVYGKTKLKGEEAIQENCKKFYIFRTAWLYGAGGKNFVQTMVNVGRAQEEMVAQRDGEAEKEKKIEEAEGAVEKLAEVSVVNDQWGSPTYAKDLAEMIYQAVSKQIPFGIYHATNEGFTNWADFTREIFRLAKINCEVKGISSEEYEKQAVEKAKEKGEERKVAPRPKNSQLNKRKLKEAGVEVRNWQEALNDYVREEQLDLPSLIKGGQND